MDQFSRRLKNRYKLIEESSHISGAVTRISWHQLCYIYELADTYQKSLSLVDVLSIDVQGMHSLVLGKNDVHLILEWFSSIIT